MTKNIKILKIIEQILIDHDSKAEVIYSSPPDYLKSAKNILTTWNELFPKDGLSEQLIKTIHSLTCERNHLPIIGETGIIGFSELGTYRTTQCSATSHIKGVKLMFINHQQIQSCMKRLVDTMNQVLISKPSAELLTENIFAFALEFIMIHPFSNHNGRTMHILIELLANQNELPPFYISYIDLKYYDELIYAQNISREINNINPLKLVLEKYHLEAQSQFQHNQKKGKE